MKTIKLIFSLAIISIIPAYLPAQSMSEADSVHLLAEFQQQTETWQKAYNSGDASHLVPLYAINAEYISSHVEGLEAKGRDNLIANFQNGMNGGGHIDSIEVLSVSVSCNLATLLCKYQATNSGVTVSGRNLLVLQKINGAWLIILHMTVV